MAESRAREIGLINHPRLSLAIEEEEAENLTRLAFWSDPDWTLACHSSRWGLEVEGCWNLSETHVRKRKRDRRKGKAWGFLRKDLSEFIKLEIWVPWFWNGAVEIGSWWWFWLPEEENVVLLGFAIISHFFLHSYIQTNKQTNKHYYYYYFLLFFPRLWPLNLFIFYNFVHLFILRCTFRDFTQLRRLKDIWMAR